MWLLRDSVANAGYYTSAPSAAAFYRRLAAEINGACEEHKLDCEANRASLMPPWHKEYAALLAGSIKRSVFYLAGFDGFSAHSKPSFGSENSLSLFRDLMQSRLSPVQLHFMGWAFSPDTPISLSVHHEDGAPADADVRLADSRDIHQYFLRQGKDYTNARRSRFDITTTCAIGCALHITAEGHLIERIRLEELKTQWKPNLYFTVDFLNNTKEGLLPRQAKMDIFKIKILTCIGKGYQAVMLMTTVLALIIYIIITAYIFNKRGITVLWISNAALLVALIVRVLILALIDITSFPGVNIWYLAPVYPLLLIFVTTAMFDGFGLVRGAGK